MSVSTYPSEQAETSAEQLSELERQYILLTQKGLPVIAQPYHWLAEQLSISVDEVLTLTTSFKERGVIRRIAAVPNHYKLGYRFNGMTVWDIDDDKASEFGEKVGKLPFVSHCYLRPRHLPDWNFNLFAMVHGKNQDEISEFRAQIKTLLNEVLQQRVHPETGKEILSCNMLTSTKILKKTGLRLKDKAKTN